MAVHSQFTPHGGDRCGRGGIGRRAGFRSRSPRGGGGSSPLARTRATLRRRPHQARGAPGSVQRVPHLVAAPDKFRGTATAIEVAAAAAAAARAAGWTADEAPLSDGGEGLLDAVGGTRRLTRVAGPLGHPVRAEWRLLPPGPDRMAQ